MATSQISAALNRSSALSSPMRWSACLDSRSLPTEAEGYPGAALFCAFEHRGDFAPPHCLDVIRNRRVALQKADPALRLVAVTKWNNLDQGLAGPRDDKAFAARHGLLDQLGEVCLGVVDADRPRGESPSSIHGI